MTRVLPDILTTEHFSSPALQVMARDGLIKRVGHWYSPATTPETAALRAASVYVDFGRRVIADTMTAAWIFGSAQQVPWPLTGCVERESRSAAVHKLGHIREVRIDERDKVMVGPLRVTSPERTFRDLCRWTAPEMPNETNRRLAITRNLYATAAHSLIYSIDLAAERARVLEARTDPRRTALLGAFVRVEAVLRQYIEWSRPDAIRHLVEAQKLQNLT